MADIDNVVASCTVAPMVNQVLAHISNTPTALIEHSRRQGMLVEAYSPIAHGELLRNEQLGELAAKYDVSVPQLSIRYVLQLGLLPLPKTANPDHMRTNANVDFEISADDMDVLQNVEPIEDYGEASVFRSTAAADRPVGPRAPRPQHRPTRGTDMERKPKPPSMKGPAEWFTGDVWLDRIAQGEGDSTIAVAAVHFAPGARTAWHAHAGGQHLYVTEGVGLVQTRGEPVEVIGPGDVTYTPDGEWHWHGATPENAMTHLSITDGQAEWGDHVTDAEYEGTG